MSPADKPIVAEPILVVEDDDDTRDALCQLLRGQGYQPVAAADGLEALRWLRRIQPRLIITDLAMPVMSGWQLVQQLRSHAAWRHIPVMVLSADTPPVIDGLCFLQKPVAPARLLGEIAAQMARPLQTIADIPAA